MADSFDFTPETAAGPWMGQEQMPRGRRSPVPTKEDLIAAISQLQAQPQSPYQLQFETPTVAGPEPSREQQFQNDWDTAMQAYQARVSHPRILPAGITFAGQGGNLDTPDLAAQATLEPLRFQAAEFSPGINRAFNVQEIERQRQAASDAQAAHWRALEDASSKKFQQDFVAQKFKESEARDKALKDAQDKAAEFALKQRSQDLRERIAQQNLLPDQTAAVPEAMPQERDVSQIPASEIIQGLKSVPRSTIAAPVAPVAPGGPKIGDVVKGYRFKGGDPSKQTNWQKL